MSVVVTQADREAAYAMFRYFNPDVQGAGNGALGGYCDDGEVVQAFALHRSEAVEELVEVLATLAEAARNACDAGKHPSLTEALFDADALISKHRGEQA